MLQRLHLANSPQRRIFALVVGSHTVRIWCTSGKPFHLGEGAEQCAYSLEMDTGQMGVVGLAFLGEDTLICMHADGVLQAWTITLHDQASEPLIFSPATLETAMPPMGRFEVFDETRRVERASPTLRARLAWALHLGIRVDACDFCAVQARVRGLLGGSQGEVFWVELTRAMPPIAVQIGQLEAGVTLARLSPAGDRGATACRDRKVAIWRPLDELPIDEQTGAWRTFEDCGGEVWALAFSHAGRHVVAGGMDKGVYLWDLHAQKALRAVSFDHEGWISDLAWSEDDRVIACASWDNTVGIFRGADLTPLYCFEHHKDYVSQVLFVPSSSYLISSSYDHTIAVWDWRSAALVTELEEHEDWIQALRWVERGVFVSASADRVMCVWSTATLSCEVELGEGSEQEWLSASLSETSAARHALVTSGGFRAVRPSERQAADVDASLRRALEQATSSDLGAEVSVFYEALPAGERPEPAAPAQPQLEDEPSLAEASSPSFYRELEVSDEDWMHRTVPGTPSALERQAFQHAAEELPAAHTARTREQGLEPLARLSSEASDGEDLVEPSLARAEAEDSSETTSAPPIGVPGFGDIPRGSFSLDSEGSFARLRSPGMEESADSGLISLHEASLAVDMSGGRLPAAMLGLQFDSAARREHPEPVGTEELEELEELEAPSSTSPGLGRQVSRAQLREMFKRHVERGEDEPVELDSQEHEPTLEPGAPTEVEFELPRHFGGAPEAPQQEEPASQPEQAGEQHALPALDAPSLDTLASEPGDVASEPGEVEEVEEPEDVEEAPSLRERLLAAKRLKDPEQEHAENTESAERAPSGFVRAEDLAAGAELEPEPVEQEPVAFELGDFDLDSFDLDFGIGMDPYPQAPEPDEEPEPQEEAGAPEEVSAPSESEPVLAQQQDEPAQALEDLHAVQARSEASQEVNPRDVAIAAEEEQARAGATEILVDLSGGSSSHAQESEPELAHTTLPQFQLADLPDADSAPTDLSQDMDELASADSRPLDEFTSPHSVAEQERSTGSESSVVVMTPPHHEPPQETPFGRPYDEQTRRAQSLDLISIPARAGEELHTLEHAPQAQDSDALLEHDALEDESEETQSPRALSQAFASSEPEDFEPAGSEPEVAKLEITEHKDVAPREHEPELEQPEHQELSEPASEPQAQERDLALISGPGVMLEDSEPREGSEVSESVGFPSGLADVADEELDALFERQGSMMVDRPEDPEAPTEQADPLHSDYIPMGIGSNNEKTSPRDMSELVGEAAEARKVPFLINEGLSESTPVYEEPIEKASTSGFLGVERSPRSSTRPGLNKLEQTGSEHHGLPLYRASAEPNLNSTMMGMADFVYRPSSSEEIEPTPEPALDFPEVSEAGSEPGLTEFSANILQVKVSDIWKMRLAQGSASMKIFKRAGAARQRWRSHDQLKMNLRRAFAVTQSEEVGYIAGAGSRPYVEVWGADQQRFFQLPGEGRAIYALANTPDGRVIIGGDERANICLWMVPAAMGAAPNPSIPRAILRGHSAPILSLAVNSTGKLLLSGSLDGTARLWSLEDGECLAILDHGAEPISGVVFWSKGLATVSHQGKLRLWDRRGIQIDLIEGYAPFTNLDAHRSSVFASSADGRVLCYQRGKTREVVPQGDSVAAVRVSPNGTLVSVGAAGTVRLDFGEHEEPIILDIGSPLNCVNFGNDLIAVGTLDGSIELLKKA